MITTQYGNEIEIRRYNPDSQTVEAVRVLDHELRSYSLSQLRADGGLDEIMQAIAFAERGE